jgi:uncharacterized repeat protein (TIGR01451 family)
MNNENKKSPIKNKEEKMKTISRNMIGALLLMSAVAVAVPQQASAAGTASGTSIANKATINYQVSGINQTAIESSPAGNSTPGVGSGVNTTFVVDDKVMMTVTANDAAAVTTYPGSSAQAMKFTVTNVGNTTHDFALSAVSLGVPTVVGATVAFYADTNTNNVYDAGIDLALPVSGSAYVDELAADASRVIFLVITVPISATNGQTANYSVTAEAHQGGGIGALGGLTKTQADADKLIADVPGTVQVVLADAAGNGDALYDGIYTRNGVLGFTISTATLTVTKISTVYSDPVNGTTLPKAIPGAIVTYTVTVANTAGTVTATNVSISDSLNAEITALPPRLAFATQFTGNVPACNANEGIVVGGACKTNGNDLDGADWSITGANTVTVTGLSLAPGASTTIKFQVTLQ